MLPKLVFSQANPQTTYDLKSMLPTSPEAAMLARFGDIPIGYYTGTADISIPLYTIKEDGVDIPITLSYHSSGVKVDDQATNVGLGWLLEPGGGIIQIVNGKADGSDTFISTLPSDYAFLKANVSDPDDQGARGQIGIGTTPCTTEPNDGDTQNSMNFLLQGDLQPDIYQYSFPGGYSGKFYINPETNKPVLIDKQNQLFFQQGIDGAPWVATTLDGDKYYFADEETSSDGTAFHQGITNKLSKIVLHNGKIINFTYASSNYSWVSGYSEYYHTPYPGTAYGFETPLEYSVQASSSNVNYYIKTITQIKTADVIINFNLGTRQDMQAPCIQSVDILNAVTGQKIKTFTFSYGYFDYSQVGSPSAGTALLGSRLKLLSVQETGYDPVTGVATNNPPYQFTYNETNPLPQKASFAKDFWGYYNGVNNTNLLTDFAYPYDAGMIDANFPYSSLSNIHGANRATDTSQVSLGMLTNITYPTGGSTKFNYESNSFSNYDYPDVNKEASRITYINATDQNSPNDHTIASFTPARTLTFIFNSSFSRGNPNNTAVTATTMATASVTLNEIKNETTTVLNQWQIATTAQQNTFNSTGYLNIPDTLQIPYDPAATYQLVASLPDALGNQSGNANLGANVAGTMTYYNVPNTLPSLSYGGGVRVASIKNYDNTGALISNKSIKYINSDGTTSGILMSPLLLDYYRSMYFVYNSNTQGGGENPSINFYTANIYYLSSESSVPFSYSACGNLVGYSRVEETELLNNAATNGKHVYYYNNAASQTGYAVPDNPNLLNGKLSKEEIYDNSANKLFQASYTYTSLSDSVFTGYKNYFNLLENIDCEPNSYEIPDGFVLYLILEYPIASHWYMLNNKTTTQYDGTNPLTISTNYTYNTMGQLTQESTANSKNETLTTNNIYPYDEFSSSSMAQSLVDSSFFNNILEQHLYNNGVETSQAKVYYATINNQLVKSEIDRSYNGGSLYTDVTFNAYGPNKTLQQATERAVQPSAFIYDQNNSYVLADAKNALLSDIAYTSFELNQAGNWTISSTARNTTGLGGNQSYALSATNTLSKSGLTHTKTYIVSYWTTASSPLTIAGTITGYPIKGATINGWTYYEHQITGQTSVTLSSASSVNIDEVRLYPNNAQMTTFTYNPLVGISTSVDAKNNISYYEYDGLQRLINIKDQYGNIIKHMDYHYQGQ